MAGLGGLVDLAGVLGGHDHGVVWAGVDADGLFVGETFVLGGGVRGVRFGVCDHPVGFGLSLGFWNDCWSMYLARVLVDQVQRVAGELDTAGLLALDKEGILVACSLSEIIPS